MALRVSSRRHFLRDLPHAYVVLSFVILSVCLLMFFFYNWSPVQREHAVRSQLSDANNDERYAGSIMIDPPRGNMCRELMFDNRTGKMWENGYVKCDNGWSQPSEKNQSHGADVMRLLEVGKAFRHESN